VAASIASLLDLQDRQLDLLLPSHGNPMQHPGPAMALLVERFWTLLRGRHQNPRLFQLRERPYEPVLPVGEGPIGKGTPHLLRHRASMANSYVLLSESGKALFIDFGYDFMTGFTTGNDRASRRPWLYTLPSLKAQFGVQHIDVVLLTHFHDDHVAGCNLLRCNEGTQVWAAENFADILENPARYNLPCLWYDPIPVDRRVPLSKPIRWEEYILTVHPLPGHTRYAVAIEFEVDGLRILATGDQYEGDDSLAWNYVYQNHYAAGDYTAGAKLYQRLRPDLILPGHAKPLHVTPEYLQKIFTDAQVLNRLHHELLPTPSELATKGFIARILPYQISAEAGKTISLEVEVRNPYSHPKPAIVRLVAPQGWSVDDGCQSLELSGTHQLSFKVTSPPGLTVRRARLAIDLTIAGKRFGQLTEALVTVLPKGAR
jgi:glyoxylase-like metal-dependent hydrolase (beta-lactamase superfamily II)